MKETDNSRTELMRRFRSLTVQPGRFTCDHRYHGHEQIPMSVIKCP